MLAFKQMFHWRGNWMSGMSRTVPDTRILKPHLRCFVCCLLGSINIRTYRQSWGCTTQGEWEVLDMGSAVIADEVEAAVKSPSSKWKQSLQRDKSSERHGNHRRPAQLNHHYLPGAASCNQITAWENSCQPGTGSEIKTWKVTLQICVNVKGVWWIGVTLRWKHSMWCLENDPV